MDLTTTQTLLVWALLGLLLAWTITFTVLAFRSNPTQGGKSEDLPTPANSFPAVPAAAILHAITSQPAPEQSGINKRHDTSGEMEPVTVA